MGCRLGSILINHLFYADDIYVFSPTSKGLQLMLNICYNYGLELDIQFNNTKCKIMIFKSKTYKKCISPVFRMGSVALDECFLYKYLGHFISHDLNDNFDIMRQCRSIYAKGNSLVCNFYRCSVEVKAMLFTMICGSLYTPQLWACYTQASMRKLTVAYHGIFKKMLNLPRWTSNSVTFVNCNVRTFQEVLRKTVFSFSSSIAMSHNFLIKNVLTDVHYRESTIFRKWNELLH